MLVYCPYCESEVALKCRLCKSARWQKYGTCIQCGASPEDAVCAICGNRIS